MLSIQPNFVNNFKSVTPLQTNPVSARSNAVSFTSNLEGPKEDTFTKSIHPAQSLSAKEKKELAQKFEKTAYADFDKKDYESCLKNLKRAVEINPESARAFHAKGSAEKELGLFEEAIEDYTRAYELRPDSANTVQLRGLTKARWGLALEAQDKEAAAQKYHEAIRDYDKSLEIKQNPDTYVLKANALMRIHGFKEAIEALDNSIKLNEEALEKNPDNQELKTKLGDAHHKKGRCLYIIAGHPHSSINRQALEEFTKAIEYVPDSANSYYQRARVNQRINYEDAQSDIKTAIEMAPERPHYWELYGNMLAFSDNPEEQLLGMDYLATAIALRQEQEEGQ